MEDNILLKIRCIINLCFCEIPLTLVGIDVGILLGMIDGHFVGLRDGMNVGSSEGECVGMCVGVNDGLYVAQTTMLYKIYGLFFVRFFSNVYINFVKTESVFLQISLVWMI